MKNTIILIIALLALVGFGIVFLATNINKESISSQTMDSVKLAESELSQVRQIVNDKRSQGIDTSGLEDDIQRIDGLIQMSKEKIREGDQTKANEIILRIREFNRVVIENQDDITNVFKTDIRIKSDITLPESLKDKVTDLGESLNNTDEILDFRIKIKRDDGKLRTETREDGILAPFQIELWSDIKESVKDIVDESTQEFEIEIRIKRELEFEDEIEIEDELEEEFENELELQGDVPDTRLSREQAVEIANSRVSGTLDRVELEIEDGRLVWNVRIISDGTRNDIRIDDITGNIVRFRTDNDDNDLDDDNDEINDMNDDDSGGNSGSGNSGNDDSGNDNDGGNSGSNSGSGSGY